MPPLNLNKQSGQALAASEINAIAAAADTANSAAATAQSAAATAATAAANATTAATNALTLANEAKTKAEDPTLVHTLGGLVPDAVLPVRTFPEFEETEPGNNVWVAGIDQMKEDIEELKLLVTALQTGLPTPAAPGGLTVNDLANTLDWTNVTGFTTSPGQYEYKVGSAGTPVTCTAKPQTGFTGAIAAGDLYLRVKAVPGQNNAGAWAQTSTEFTTGSGTFTDNFTDTNGVLITAHGTGWVLGSGTAPFINNNKLNFPAGVASFIWNTSGSATKADANIAFKITTEGSCEFWVATRIVDVNNYYRIVFSSGNGYDYNCRLEKVVAGVMTPLTTAVATPIIPATQYAVTLAVSGQTHTLQIANATPLVMAGDGTYTAAGYTGFQKNTEGGSYVLIDDFTVAP